MEDARHYAVKGRTFTAEQLLSQRYRLADLFENATDIFHSDKTTVQYILDRVVMDAVEFVFALQQ
jgi:hypothetical protein